MKTIKPIKEANMLKDSDRDILLFTSKFLKQKSYWLKKLSDPLETTDILFDPGSRPLPHPGPARIEMDLPGELGSRIIKLSKGSDLSIYILLLSALKTLIFRYTSSGDIIVGSPINTLKATEETINRLLFIRDQVDDSLSFKDLVLKVRQSVLEAYENQDYPFDKLIEILFSSSASSPGKENKPVISNILCSLENLHAKRDIENITAGFSFGFSRTGNRIKGQVCCDTGTCTESEIKRFSTHFINLLSNVLGNVTLKIADISFLTEKERTQLLEDFNHNPMDFCRDKAIYHFIEEWAQKTPDTIALMFKENEITYRDLNQRVDQLTRHLRDRDVGEDRMLGILLERSLRMVESILAVWKAGGAYIPFEPADPWQRIIEIIKDSQTRVLITESRYMDPHFKAAAAGEPGNPPVRVIKLDQYERKKETDAETPAGKPEPRGNMNRLSYVIYTSGSTGKPKGAMIEHMGMMNHIHAKIRGLQLSDQSIVAQNASHTFDISVWQFFASLISGGKTVIYPHELILEPDGFITRLIRDRVTILEVVPAYLSVMLDNLEPRTSLALPLHYLLVTGEEVKPLLVKKWFERYPHITMVNAYGPTEASDDITHYVMNRARGRERIPIGKSLPNLNIYIVDKNMQLCPPGVKGEICVSGIGVGRGYLNDPQLTAERFCLQQPGRALFEKTAPPGPPRKNFLSEGTRGLAPLLYRTGDLGRWLPDGTIEFFGRKDHQVKIRGFRIELGEIESKLLNHTGIKDAVAMEREDTRGNKYLCAYVVPQPVEPGEAALKDTRLKDWLSRELPFFMIPEHVVELERIPLTANGKIDRSALPEPQYPGSETIPYISTKMLEELAFTIGKPDEPAAPVQREPGVLQDYSRQTGRNYYPLSHPQKMIYYMEKKYPGTASENLAHLVCYPGQLDRKRLEKAINIVLNKNDALRLRIVEIEKESDFIPAQYIADYRQQQLDYFDFSGKEDKQQLQRWVEQQTSKPFEFIDSPLFYFACIQLNENQSGYYMNLHHIISDQWACFLLFKEINKTYEALEVGKPVDDNPNFSYLRYISDERDYLSSPPAVEDMKFWYNYLHPLPEAVDLSTRPGDIASIKGEVCYLSFPGDLRAHMHEYAKSHHTTLYKLILSALSIYIWQAAGTRDFVVGTLNHNRSTQRHKKTVGPFIRFIPLRVGIDDSMSFQQFVRETGDHINDIVKNRRRFPFDLLAAKIRGETGIDPGYMYNINLIGHPDLKEEPFKIERPFQGYEAAPLSIHINRFNKDIYGILELEYVYQEKAFQESDMKQVHQGLVNILTEVLTNPGIKLSEIPPIMQRQKNPIHNQGNINGNRLDTGKIESCLLAVEGIKEAAVIAREAAPTGEGTDGEAGKQYPCAYIVSGKRFKALELREYLLIKLPGYMIPSYFIQLEKMPLTGEGNVNRNVLQALKIKRSREQEYKTPRDEVENQLQEIWHDVLGVEKSKISIDTNFFELGGHSLKAIMMASKIHKAFNIKIALVEIFKTPTIKDLARYIKNETRDLYAAIEKVEEKDYYPLSSGQKQMYILHQMELESTIYNMTNVIPLPREPDIEKLETTFKELIKRHESLRTSFHMLDDQPVQRVHDLQDVEFKIEYYRFNPDNGAQDAPKMKNIEKGESSEKVMEDYMMTCQDHLRKHFSSAFALSQAPLLKVVVVKTVQESCFLVVVMHHIISDGVSHAILGEDFMALYQGEKLPLFRLKYKDYAEWQNSKKEKEKIKQQEMYWLKEFEGDIPVLNLPADYEASGDIEPDGVYIAAVIEKDQLERLKALEKSENFTMFMILLAIYNVLFFKITGQEDIIIGTVTAGRSHADLENIIGMFVNTLALRNYPRGDMTFRELLKRVKKRTLEAFSNQDYHFEDLVKKVVGKREIGRNPLLDVVFFFISRPGDTSELDQNKTLDNIPIKFDLNLAVLDRKENMVCAIGYRKTRFKQETIERLRRYFKEIVSAVVSNHDILLQDITISSELGETRSRMDREDEIGFGF